MRRRLSLLNAAADGVVRLRTRSVVIVLCLAGILAPFLVATAIFEAVKAGSAVSIEEGADLYVSTNRAGRNGPVPTALAAELRALPGVERVVPRIVGRDYIVGPVVVAGMPLHEIPSDVRCVEGTVPASPGDALVGAALAAELNLAVGKSFTLNVNPGIRLRVVGTFDAGSPVWGSRLVLVALEDAQEVFGMEGEATELLVYTLPGYADPVYARLTRGSGPAPDRPPLRVVSKRIAREMFRRGFSRRAGFFSSLYVVAFALAIPTIAVASGLGLSERRREIGLYRAAGWQTVEVMELVLYENLILSIGGATLALLLSIAWMKATNGFFVAQFFLPEVGLAPPFEVPTRFLPLPALLAYLLALVLTMVGTLYTTWRASTTPPMEVIQ